MPEEGPFNVFGLVIAERNLVDVRNEGTAAGYSPLEFDARTENVGKRQLFSISEPSTREHQDVVLVE